MILHNPAAILPEFEKLFDHPRPQAEATNILIQLCTPDALEPDMVRRLRGMGVERSEADLVSALRALPGPLLYVCCKDPLERMDCLCPA